MRSGLLPGDDRRRRCPETVGQGVQRGVKPDETRPNGVSAGSQVARTVAVVRMHCMATKHDPSTTLEKQESRLKPPPMYQVMLLNDDFTPMEFVVSVLQKFFGMSRERAVQVMLKVHREGRGVCGLYPRDVAATKVEQVSSYAREHQHPLQCVMEEA